VTTGTPLNAMSSPAGVRDARVNSWRRRTLRASVQRRRSPTPEISIADALRQLLVVARRIGADDVTAWLRSELEG
jgi:hypothetical protein